MVGLSVNLICKYIHTYIKHICVHTHTHVLYLLKPLYMSTVLDSYIFAHTILKW